MNTRCRFKLKYLFLPLLSLAVQASAEIYEVTPGQSIQVAVNAAVSGDTILIHDGAYHESVVLYGKALTIGSLFLLDGDTSHIALTSVTGSSLRPDTASAFVYAYGESAAGLLCGLTLSGQGTRSNLTGFVSGGAVFINQGSARIHHCRLVNSTAQQGGGLDARGSWNYIHLELRDCTIRNCRDDIYAGGMHARQCSLDVVNSLFDADTSSSTGGLDISESASTVDSCEFIHCWGRYTGGLHYYMTMGKISNCLFTENGTELELDHVGDAHLLVTGGAVDIFRNTFRNNSVSCFSVEMLWSVLSHRIVGNVIENNVTSYVTGTLLAGNESVGEIAYNVIRNNRNSFGGAFYGFGHSRVHVHHNWFEDNVSDDPDAGSVVFVDDYIGVIDSNIIVNNPGQTMKATNNHTHIDARNNWWGASSGPYHPTLNPMGEGDTLLSDSVFFIPWLTEPPDTSFPDLSVDRARPEITRTWELLEFYPNPFNASFQIVLAGFTGNDFAITLHNLLGQTVDVIHSGAVTGGVLSYTAPPVLSSGVYFVRAMDRNSIQTKKVVLLK